MMKRIINQGSSLSVKKMNSEYKHMRKIKKNLSKNKRNFTVERIIKKR